MGVCACRAGQGGLAEEDLAVPSHYAMTQEGKGYRLVLSLVLFQVLPGEGVPQPGQEYPRTQDRGTPRTVYGVNGTPLAVSHRTYLFISALECICTREEK